MCAELHTPHDFNGVLLQPLDSEDQARLIARHGGQTVDGAEVYQLDIIMAGANETPFFDDFES